MRIIEVKSPMKGMINMKNNNIIITMMIAFLLILIPAGNISAQERMTFNDEQKNVGIYMKEWSDLDNFPITPDIIAWFENWYGPNSFLKLNLCAENHTAIPLITWQPQNVPLWEIADGIHDGYIMNFLQNITNMVPDIDVLIRFAHEMEVRPQYRFSWYSWQGERDPEAYIEAWRHIVTLARQVNPNIKWIWSPNRADQYSDPYYPGDEYVDYISVTMNLREDDANYTQYNDFRSYYETIGIREHLEKYGKKIFISEVGYSNPKEEEKQVYIESIFDYYLQDPLITAMIFFDENSSDNSQYKITDNPRLLEAFNEGFRRIVGERK